MKKMLAAAVLVIGVLLLPAAAFASVPGNWNPTWENAGVTLEYSADQVVLTSKGENSWVSTFTSSEAQDPNGFTWKFKLKLPTVYSQAPHPEIENATFDLWYGFGFNDGVQSTLGSSGIYILFKPISESTTRVQLYARSGDNNQGYDEVDLPIAPTSEFTVRLAKDGENWGLTINGTPFPILKDGKPSDMNHLTEGFASLGQGGKAFPYVGIWSQPPYKELDTSITFTQMETTSAPAAAAAAGSGTQNPKTGDAGIAVYAAMALVSAAALAFLFLRKKAVRQ